MHSFTAVESRLWILLLQIRAEMSKYCKKAGVLNHPKNPQIADTQNFVQVNRNSIF